MQKHKWQFNIIAPWAIALIGAMSPAALQAQVQTRTGVRSDAMGGAFVAVSNDVNGLQFSPAGLLNSTRRTQVELAHHRLFPDLSGDMTLNSVGFVHNISSVRRSKDKLMPTIILVSSGASVLAGPAPPMAPDTSLHRFSFGLQWLGLQFPGQSQNTLAFSVSVGLSGLGLLPKPDDLMQDGGTIVQKPNRLALGLSARYIRFGYDKNYLLDQNEVNSSDELDAIRNFIGANKIDASDFAVDASLAFFISSKWQGAISILNLKQPNLAAQSGEAGTKSPEGLLGRRYRVGVAYHAMPNLLVAVDLEKNDQVEAVIGDVNAYGGAEYLWQNGFVPMALRGGVNRNWLATGFGLQLERIIRQNLMFNWVYQYSLHGQGLSNFRFALDYAWR
jgi:hypothetical protein